MGSLMAARLSEAQRAASSSAEDSSDLALDRVVLYGRPSAHLTEVAANGLRLTEFDGETHVVPIETTSNPADVEGSDIVLVLVKSWATADAVKPLRPFLTRDAAVLTLQNGLGNAAVLRTSLLDRGVRPHVWLGVTTQAAVRTAPGEVVHTGRGITAIGRRKSTVNERIQQLARVMSTASLQAIAVDDIHRWVWRKLAVNCAINPLTALAGVTNAAIHDDAGLAKAAAQIAQEVVAIARAQSITIDMADVTSAIEEVARQTGANRSSMLMDVAQQQRTEIDAINGAIVLEGVRLGIPTPINDLMTTLIRARESTFTPDVVSSFATIESYGE